MKIINKKYLIVILLVGIILTGAIFLKPNKKVKLDNVILKQEVNNKTFAMYKEDAENNYVPVEGTKFPEMYVLNLTESKCIDNNGNELTGVLSYENGTVTITSGNTTYCYLYFDKTLGVEIFETKDISSHGLKIDKVRGEMYRFQGQQSKGINNYICFGTSDKELCKKDANHYMYRIIGIEAETGRVKVIKKEALENTIQWWDNRNNDTKFPESRIYEIISGNGFLENTDYVPVDKEKNIDWKEKIANNTWTYGDMWSNDTIGARQTGEGLYQTETGKKATEWYNYATAETPGAIQTTVGYEDSPYYGNTVYYTNGSGSWTQSFTGKVSLMYLHDYHYSVSDEANCQYAENNYAICQTSWMHLSQNDTDVLSGHEWTMSRSGWSYWDIQFYGHMIDNAGCDNNWSLDSSLSIRPVFYINASEELLDGEGTLTDPFIIKL